MTQPTSYLIDHILPAYQVHLMAGPSGIGKTRWLYWMLKDWLAEKTVLGYPSHPCPTMYLAADRNWASLTETLSSIGCLGIVEQRSILHESGINPQTLHIKFPHIKLFILDPITVFVPHFRLNDYGTVSYWLKECTHICERDGITIIGIGHSPKLKEGSLLINPRERILGSAAWGGFSETLFILGSEQPDKTNAVRHTYVLPRNWKEEVFYWKLVDGWPILVDSPEEDALYGLFVTQIPEEPTSRQDLSRMANSLGVASATLDRYLRKALADGYIVKTKYGHYKRLPVS